MQKSTPITINDSPPTFLEPLSSIKTSNFRIKDPKLAQLPYVNINRLSPTLFQNKIKIVTGRKKGSRTGKRGTRRTGGTRETGRNRRKGKT